MAEKDTQPMSQRAEDSQNVAPTNDSPSWGLLFWTERRERDTERLRIEKNMYKVGRGLASDIVLSQDNCSLPVDKLSRIHCGFKRVVDMISGDQTILEDYSSNGTFVNGLKIGQGRSKLLCHRDVISLTCPHKKIFIYLDTQYRHPSFPTGISKKYVIGEDLGKGSFGDVWLVINKQTNKQYALKSVTRRYEQYLDDRFDAAMMQLKNEAELLCTLIHPCIVKVEDVICRTNSIHLVLELMHGGDLQARLSGRPQLKEATAKYYFYQLVLAVEFCHKLGVVHRDLKPENILLSSKEEDAILKITDFGLSKLVDENTMLKTYCGTPMYLAPEVVEAKDEKSHYTSSVDVWSLGVILFVLLSGYHPFVHSKPLEKLIAKADYVLKKEKWKKVSKDGLALVKKMLQVNPDNRPTLTEILDHPWMQDPDMIVKVRKLVFANCSIGGHSVFNSSFSSLTENDPIFDPLPPKRRRTGS